MKRFQHSNWLVKLWRYRHYLYIPFKWLWYKYIKPFEVINDTTLKKEEINTIRFRKLIKKYGIKKTIFYFFKGKLKCELWSVLIGMAQSDMAWFYTWDEVKDRFGILVDDVIDDVDDNIGWRGID